MFASIEDSDSDPDHHGEDSSSNASADDHMSTKRSHCCLRGGGVKEVRGSGAGGPVGVVKTLMIAVVSLLYAVAVTFVSVVLHYYLDLKNV